MKTALAVITMICISFTAHAGKMGLPLRMLVDKPSTGKAMLGKAVSIRGESEQVDVLVKSFDTQLTKTAIEEAGGTVRTIVGNIMTAFVPVDFLAELASYEEVDGIEASKRMTLNMDTSRSNTGVATLQSGFEGTQYTGNNVVVGVIDTGLDYSRNDFKNASAASRVQYLRFQSASGTTITATECANDSIDDGTCAIPDDNDSAISHGTHVTGIAAGSDSTYTGNAPAADIMLVRNDFTDDVNEGGGTFSGGVLDGVVEIFKKADILDKPAVINISQGSHIGAHDNTSLLEQGLNSAVTGGYDTNGKNYGRVIAVAAGNEHIVDALLGAFAAESGGIHAPFSVAAGTNQGWRLRVLVGDAVGRTPLVVDSWFGSGQNGNCSLAANVYPYSTVAAPGTTTTDAVAATGNMPLSVDDSTSSSSGDNKVDAIVAIDASDSQNQQPRGLVGFQPGSAGSWNAIEIDTGAITGYVMDVIIRASGGTCSGNMWIEGGGTFVHFMKSIGAFDVAGGANGDAYTLEDGDNNMTVGLPGTASGVITVGAYLQEKPFGSGLSQWTAQNGTTYDATDVSEPAGAQINGGTVGSRCPFSSIGPTADGRLKPEILAPGDPIISTLATGYSPDAEVLVNSTHFKSQGTSQASPQIAGFVALLLEKNNTLTAAEAKSAITGTAAAAMVLGKADNSNGYGKVNATAAMQSISADTSGYSGTGNLTTADLNGGGSTTSSGGCGGTIAPITTSSAGLMALMVAFPAIVIAIRRRRR